MIQMTTHTTRVFDDENEGLEVELEIELGSAEPDVGIHGPFIDNWSVIAVDGDTNEELCLEIEQNILDEYGDDVFIERLYDEGVAS